MGDIRGLIDIAPDSLDQEEAMRLTERMMSGRFTLNDMYKQMEMMSKIGTIDKIVSHLPTSFFGGLGTMDRRQKEEMQGNLERFRVIMDSMTEEEKKLFGIDKLNIKRSDIPAVTHIDYSARIQTVHKNTNPKYYKLIKNFENITNCPIIVNTSFNVRGEPIVCSIKDAYSCFMGTDLDILVCGDFILYKEKQNKQLKDLKNKFI